MQCFSKCGARPTGGAQRCDRWVANGRGEREIIILFFNKLFGPQAGIEPGSSRAVVDCLQPETRNGGGLSQRRCAGASEQRVFAVADAVHSKK